MQIKIGFVHNARELVLESEESQDAVVERVETFLASTQDNATLSLSSSKGAKVVLVRDKIAYVEVGTETKNSVGFL
ncbi:DUF3107 domain-containing protein [Corynebacterium sp. 320]|uniref:DUF3107 domain-containing protein n=1 Tax=Corynebacterium zhongnanshanii TaxID=2768834 RepID=A0ABQ6VF11_9CORY|nr:MULTISPECIES: DUF3107 domain-containing protein [Corynebacterium]KAB1504152.1 DUF3107 domain-containing protein [Corynebacterium sp. 320]KAB1552748.1 DUF3107 domain-containing protein [Corynebacterium sp. 321]KAB1554034.1 DUF3107 domain-containing protein [Corynebacterium sp. 319]KAB3522994.1 DUF3107 domain-containing protein [Corynebacterium zhongnanshanii]KAB3528288.1 DUF3107 domain-containing protein [Corynebacterium sp. 250]